MENILFDQLIYGKSGLGEDGDFYVTACPKNISETLSTVITKDYRFWNEVPVSKDHHNAVGIFFDNKKNMVDLNPIGYCDLVVVQVQPPLEETGQRKILERYFYQYRYLFLKQQDKNIIQDILHHRFPELLLLLSKGIIPCKSRKDSLDANSSELVKINQEFLNKQRQLTINFIEKITNTSENQEFNFISSAIKFLLDNIRKSTDPLIIVSSQEASNTAISYVQCIYLLLPKTYRKHLSLVIGYVDKKTCKHANLIVSIVDEPSEVLHGYHQVNQGIQIYSNINTLNKLEIGYLESFHRFLIKNRKSSEINKILNSIESQKTENFLLSKSNSYEELLENYNRYLTDELFNLISSIGSNRDTNREALLNLLQGEAKESSQFPKPDLFVNKIDQVCNLNLETWSDINEHFIKSLKLSGNINSVIKIIDLLLNSQLSNNHSECSLTRFKKLNIDNRESLTFSSLIDYTQKEPENWDEFRAFAESASSTSKEKYLEILDLALGCSESWKKSYLNPVLITFIQSYSDSHLKEFINTRFIGSISKKQFNWQRIFHKDPSNYIYKLLDNNNFKNLLLQKEIFLIATAEFLVNYCFLTFGDKRCRQLSPNVKEKLFEYADQSNKEYEHFSNILFRFIDLGLCHDLQITGKKILAKRILLTSKNTFNYAIGYFLKIQSSIVSDSNLFSVDLKNQSHNIIIEFINSNQNEAEIHEFLRKCHYLYRNRIWLKKTDLLEILLKGLERSKSNSSIANLLIRKFIDWKLYEKEGAPKAISNFLKSIASVRTYGIEQDNLFQIYHILSKELKNPSQFWLLRSWKSGLGAERRQELYRQDLKAICFILIIQHKVEDIEKYIEALAEHKQERQELSNTFAIYEGRIMSEEHEKAEVNHISWASLPNQRLMNLIKYQKTIINDLNSNIEEIEDSLTNTDKSNTSSSLVDKDTKSLSGTNQESAREEKKKRGNDKSLGSITFNELFPTFNIGLKKLSTWSPIQRFLNQLAAPFP